jgi:aminoglycoside phosphotransferase (APT) family kinase protein
VLAVDGERAWMLMEPIPHADDETHAPKAPEIARRLARLQLDTLAERDVLLAAGASDRGRDATLAWLRTVVHDSVEQHLMTEEQRAAAAELEPWLVERVERLWSFGLPDALCHGDLHLGNVAWTDHGPVFFDWTDACLTHPFLDARHLADSAAETGEAATAAPEEVVAAVWDAYAEPWRAAYPALDLDEVWRHVADVEAIFQMISYEQIYRAQPPSQRWELATIVVELLDKLVASSSRGSARAR